MSEKIVNHKILFLIAYVFTVFCSTASALPSYKRIWESKYSYTTSCTLCHGKGGGSQLNSYGEDFQRFGMTQAAFSTIEKRDSDKDGASNLEEIQAKSNPGDLPSNPKNKTDWLSRIEESLLPVVELKKIFPGTANFSVLEGTLFQAQSQEVEKDLSKKLSETDLVPTFYFAIQDQAGVPTRIGVAIFSTPNSNPEKLIVGVGVDLAGKIKNVVLIKNKLSKEIGSAKFLEQFRDKTYQSSMTISKDIQPASTALIAESDLVIEAVRKSLLIVRVVFNKNKKAVNNWRIYEIADLDKICLGGFVCRVDEFFGVRQ